MDCRSSTRQRSIALCTRIFALLSIGWLIGDHRLSAQQPSGCECASQFLALAEKLEQNYIGFALEVNGDRVEQYRQMRSALEQRSSRTDLAHCLEVLQEYAYWFRDGHVFISDVWGESDSTFRRPERRQIPDMDEKHVRAILAERGKQLDPIEGIWSSSEGYRVGVIPESQDGSAERFVGVMLTAGIDGWKPGDVKAEYERRQDGTYSTTLFNAQHVPVHPSVYLPNGTGAHISRGSLFVMSPFTWGRIFPLDEQNACRIDPTAPLAPLVFPYARDTSVWVVSLPSCDPAYANRLDSLLHANEAAIASARVLIIDIRGNEGGSSGTTRTLDKYMGPADSARSAVLDGDTAVVLSSKDNIKYFTYMLPNGWVPKGLIDRMTAGPGTIVPFSDPVAVGASKLQDAAGPGVETSRTGPAHVAVLMDRNVVSAGEEFCLHVKRYPRVTLFGDNTAGCIDYQNVTMVYFGCEAAGYILGYPTLASSAGLPVGGHNRTGIAPDVRVPTAVPDPYREIAKYYPVKQ